MEASTLFCQGVCIFSNSFSALCNEVISGSVFVDNNVIESSGGYYVTISSIQPCDRLQYQEYKDLAYQYGKIEECIYEEGMLEISLTCIDYEHYEMLSTIISNDEKAELVCG